MNKSKFYLVAFTLLIFGCCESFKSDILPPRIESQKLGFISSSIPELELRAEQIKEAEVNPIESQLSDPLAVNERGVNNSFQSRRFSKSFNAHGPKKFEHMQQNSKYSVAKQRELRMLLKAHNKSKKRSIKSATSNSLAKKKNSSQKSNSGAKTGLKSSAKKHRSLIARIAKALDLPQRPKAIAPVPKSNAERTATDQKLREILLEMPEKRANRLIRQLVGSLPGKPIHLTRRSLLQQINGERKLNILDDTLDWIKGNLLLVGGALAVGGHFYRRNIDRHHNRVLKTMGQLRATLNLKVGLMNEAMELLDKINGQMRIEANRLQIQDEMFDKGFQNKIDRIKNIPI